MKLTTEINGRPTQEGNTNSMLFNPSEIVHYLSNLTILEKGDLILTGTPPGWKNNKLNRGDRVVQRIESIGELQYDIVVMVQGDEPMTHPEMITEAVTPMLSDPEILITNLLEK